MGVVKGYVDVRTGGTSMEEEEVYAVRDWVIVDYDGKDYPGEIVAVGRGDVKVNVMDRKKGQGFWYWPKPKDECDYLLEKVKGRINPPDPVGTRGQYRFREVYLS